MKTPKIVDYKYIVNELEVTSATAYKKITKLKKLFIEKYGKEAEDFYFIHGRQNILPYKIYTELNFF